MIMVDLIRLIQAILQIILMLYFLLNYWQFVCIQRIFNAIAHKEDVLWQFHHGIFHSYLFEGAYWLYIDLLLLFILRGLILSKFVQESRYPKSHLILLRLRIRFIFRRWCPPQWFEGFFLQAFFSSFRFCLKALYNMMHFRGDDSLMLIKGDGIIIFKRIPYIELLHGLLKRYSSWWLIFRWNILTRIEFDVFRTLLFFFGVMIIPLHLWL